MLSSCNASSVFGARFHRFLFYATLFISPFFLSGCASIFGKKIQEVLFDSEPEGAKVYVSGYFAGRTPVTVRLKISAEYDIVYVYGEAVREFKIRPISYTQHTSNRFLCIIDLFPGVLFLGGPPLVDIFTGSCRGFQTGYFKSMFNNDDRHEPE